MPPLPTTKPTTQVPKLESLTENDEPAVVEDEPIEPAQDVAEDVPEEPVENHKDSGDNTNDDASASSVEYNDEYFNFQMA